ncbi:hypothetical protein [Streptomyces sp. NPDC004435]|uniref:hypothetical protein n=1 Tax=Streptomyces sp. NPDC004435 TaxID=3364701 RepID=UPI0036BA464F
MRDELLRRSAGKRDGPVYEARAHRVGPEDDRELVSLKGDVGSRQVCGVAGHGAQGRMLGQDAVDDRAGGVRACGFEFWDAGGGGVQVTGGCEALPADGIAQARAEHGVNGPCCQARAGDQDVK